MCAVTRHGWMEDVCATDLRVRRVRRHQLAVARNWQPVVDHHLACDAIQMQLDQILARRV
jgi:hypothetical protein